MSERLTIEEVFKLSASAEEEASKFYAMLAESFSERQDVAQFFMDMSREELGHLKWIRQMHKKIAPEKLKELAPNRAAELINTFLKFKAEDAINEIRSLDDAYKLSVKLEFSETGKLHELIIDLFEDSEKKKGLMKLLNEHFEKIRSFSSKFGDSVVRSGILPKPRSS